MKTVLINYENGRTDAVTATSTQAQLLEHAMLGRDKAKPYRLTHEGGLLVVKLERVMSMQISEAPEA